MIVKLMGAKKFIWEDVLYCSVDFLNLYIFLKTTFLNI